MEYRDGSPEDPSEDRLLSWKEIAAYLRFGVRTVQRWEENEGLPVHRRTQDRRSTVFASKRELDSWYESRKSTLIEEQREEGRDPVTVESLSAPVEEPPPGPKPARSYSRNVIGAVCLTVVSALTGAFFFSRFPASERTDSTFWLSVLPPDGMSFSFGTDTGGSAISPDGHNLALVLVSQGTSGLWVRSLQSSATRRLSGTEGAYHPFWSPDSRALAFFSGGKLKRVALLGGAPIVICDAPMGRRGSWSARGLIVFTPALGSGLSVVPDFGGEAKTLSNPDRSLQEYTHLWPFFLPDGEHVLYVARSKNPENSAIYVSSVNPAAGIRRRLISASSNVLYAPSGRGRQGHLLFARDGKLWAQPFNVDRLDLKGDPRVISDIVGYWSNMRLANFSVSDTGVLAFSPSGSDLTQLIWVGRDGRTLSRVTDPDLWFAPELSPDNTSVAMGRTDAASGLSSIWLLDLSRQVLAKFTSGHGRDGSPVWSPDGKRVVFLSARSGPFEIYSKDSTRSGSEQSVLRSAGSLLPFDVSRDGRFLLYGESLPKTRFDLWVLPLFGDGRPFALLRSPADELDAKFSRDGRFVAYMSDESGRDEIYVQGVALEAREAPLAGRKWQVSSQGGSEPRWRLDGSELFYRSPGGFLMSVPVGAGPSNPVFGTPRSLFRIATASQFRGTFSYDAASNGQRFLILQPAGRDQESPITVIVNWEQASLTQ